MSDLPPVDLYELALVRAFRAALWSGDPLAHYIDLLALGEAWRLMCEERRRARENAWMDWISVCGVWWSSPIDHGFDYRSVGGL